AGAPGGDVKSRVGHIRGTEPEQNGGYIGVCRFSSFGAGVSRSVAVLYSSSLGVVPDPRSGRETAVSPHGIKRTMTGAARRSGQADEADPLSRTERRRQERRRSRNRLIVAGVVLLGLAAGGTAVAGMTLPGDTEVGLDDAPAPAGHPGQTGEAPGGAGPGGGGKVGTGEDSVENGTPEQSGDDEPGAAGEGGTGGDRGSGGTDRGDRGGGRDDDRDEDE